MNRTHMLFPMDLTITNLNNRLNCRGVGLTPERTRHG